MEKGKGRGRFGKFKRIRGIYKITNRITGNCYIGKSEDIQYRFRVHKIRIDCGCPDNPKWANDIRLYGRDAFEYELLEEVEGNEEIPLAQAERKWYFIIKPQYNRDIPRIPVREWRSNR